LGDVFEILSHMNSPDGKGRIVKEDRRKIAAKIADKGIRPPVFIPG